MSDWPEDRGPLRDVPRRRKDVRADVDEEIAHHIAQRTADLVAEGLAPEAARAEAMRRFGDVDWTTEACVSSDWRKELRRTRRSHLEDARMDVAIGWRQLRRRPGFALVALVTLAVGIGANTAIFSAADHVLLRPLPYRDADRVVTLWETDRDAGDRRLEPSPGDFASWEERATAFSAMGLAIPFGYDLTGDGPPVPISAWLVTAHFMEALGVRPILGRAFEPAEYVAEGSTSVLLSHRFWQQRFGGDPAIVGRAIGIDTMVWRVVGVLPPGIEYPTGRDVWAPIALQDFEVRDRTSNYEYVVGRLADGVGRDRAQSDMDRVAAQLAAEFPETNARSGARVVPLEEQILGPVRPALLVLLVAVGFVLLIACANVASLLIARATERRRELAVRAALGAGHGRLVRQLMTEGMLLAALGGAAGIGLAAVLVRSIALHGPAELPRIGTVTIDTRVLVFSVVTTLVTGLLFCAAPALRFSRPELGTSLRSGGRVGGGRSRLRDALVTAEIALAVMLLIGAGLLGRSFVTLLHNDLGFETEQRVEMQAFLWDRNPTAQQRLARTHEFVDALSAVRGVEQVEVVSSLPFHPHAITAQSNFTITGRSDPAAGQQLRSHVSTASAGYFAALGIPLVRGRAFADADRPDHPRVAIVNAAFVRRYLPDVEPLGQRITVGVMDRPVEREIVGVVGDVRPTALDADPRPELFVPFEQSGIGSITFVIRTAGDPGAMLPTLRRAFWSVDPGQSIYQDATLDELVSATLVARRFNLVLLGAFSTIALVLAAIGIYGLVSFSTQLRTAEIGIRMALGARSRQITGMIVREGLSLAAPGVALGVAGALLLTRFMRHMLYGIPATDPLTFAQLSLFVLVIAAAAAWIPARRAVARDPIRALRSD